MKGFLCAILLVLLLPGCEDTNILLMTDAASDALSAVTLSDEDVHRLAGQAIEIQDEKNRVAPPGNPYAVRLHRLTRDHVRRDGRVFDFRVYLTDNINAFAMADGSIRVFSGLMDLMDDPELLFIIGHEMGHVAADHSRKKVVMAYATSAVRKGLAAHDSEIGQLARSILGGLAQQLANAQFSQHEEREADRYGTLFIQELGYDEAPAVSALNKLAALARNHTVLSSHPDPESRAQRLMSGEEAGEDPPKSMWAKLLQYVGQIVQWVLALIMSLLRWLISLL